VTILYALAILLALVWLLGAIDAWLGGMPLLDALRWPWWLAVGLWQVWTED